MNIVILAAGQGKRMRSTLPKVLQPLAGRPLLAHVIDTARATAHQCQSAARIVVVIGHGAQAVRSAFAGQQDLHFVEQQPQLGTGHAVLQAVPWLREDVATLVLYGDVPLVRSQTLVALIEAASGHLGLLTVRLANPSGYGRILRDAAGHVQGIVEERDAEASQRQIDEVNTGILVAPTQRLKHWLEGLSNANAQAEYYLTDVVVAARAENMPVSAVVATDADETLGVNSKSQLAHLERIVQRRSADALMEAGATLADPSRIEVRGELSVGSDVFIDVGCVFEGKVALGDHVHIGPHCVLRDTVVGARSVLHAFCHLDGAQIGTEVLIGPYARLRPGAQLDDQVHIGNFVEVKASHLEQGAKANHLAYVGDAHVGARSNIGAGTIFANYDGANKHRTEVGENVHVGSNAVLVAPIRVGAGATIGAGSTVVREVPPDKLTVARARQVTIEGWKRPTKKR
ncbi:MAG TPA: bifunctional UDP-N-acetylglucosamine diphosphorylase/glucosamine-1-phosphate N-acetyltransferase GlmU [Burkholderiaceae bacterium]|nr:bifunctional UDP-N-acetylglucosamine diphosphorylase/glucosamine-1-phosphate N-acetyltransferase GlmU [Burkholderiaceae bacterium]